MAWCSRLRWVVGLGLLVLLAACGRQVELMAAMPEPEANEILAALQTAGIGATKVSGKEGMVGVNIDGDKVGRAMELLREKGLPRERFAGMGQVFKKEGLISSPLEERARYLYALSQELSATLSQLDGVVVARVHVVLPERSTVGEAAVPSSAAVFIKHQDGYNLDTLQPLIRRLVIHSIPGLTPDKVSIVLVTAQPHPVPGEDRVAPGATVPATPAAAAVPAPGTGSGNGGNGAGNGGGWLTLAFVLSMALAGTVGGGGFLAWRLGWRPRWRAGGDDARATKG